MKQEGPQLDRFRSRDGSETARDRAGHGAALPKSIADRVSPNGCGAIFYELDGKYRVAMAIRDMCVFAKHDVQRDPPVFPHGCDQLP